VACANFAYAAELDGKKPPPDCDKGGANPAKTREELIAYLRDSFTAMKKSLGAITKENMFEPTEGPYAGPNTRLGLATVCLSHVADHYGQLVMYAAQRRRAARQPGKSARAEGLTPLDLLESGIRGCS
jgi:hypothetical protein